LPVGWISALAFSPSRVLRSGFSLSRIAVISVMVLGGATKPAGRALAAAAFGAAATTFGAASVGTAATALPRSGAAVRPAAAFIAAWMQALTDGEDLARQASRFPAPPDALMQARTIGVPTVALQFSRAASRLSACAAGALVTRTTAEMTPFEVAEIVRKFASLERSRSDLLSDTTTPLKESARNRRQDKQVFVASPRNFTDWRDPEGWRGPWMTARLGGPPPLRP